MAGCAPSLLLIIVSLSSLYSLVSAADPPPFQDISLDNPNLEFTLSPSGGHSCKRVRVAGLSRLDLRSYPSSFRVTVNASEVVPEKLHEKIEICFHRNVSIDLCQCGKDLWQPIQKGKWINMMSPYEVRYVDVRFNEKSSGSVTVSVKEEFQQWRLFCLGLGFLLLLFAPIISNWVPFYYSSSMALGVLLVVLLILFQGMKLLPMGRKNIFYLTIYGSALGVGSFIAHYFSTMVNSILVNFGLSDEMHNPVAVFLALGIILAGAALGYWIVRKYILSEDGSVDIGVAQFVKWAMRIFAAVLVLQSTIDPLLAVLALFTWCCFCSLVSSLTWRRPVKLQQRYLVKSSWQRKSAPASTNNRHAEFFNKPTMRNTSTPLRGGTNSAHVWSTSPVKGLVQRSPMKVAHQEEDHYSTFHKTPTSRKLTKKEWDDFTRESTSEALTEWASTPEVSKWLAENAHRMRIQNDDDCDESMESSSGSSEETAVENGSGLSLLKWF